MGSRVGRWAVVTLLAASTVGCGGAATTSIPTMAPDPGASSGVFGEAEAAVCDGTVRMEQGAARLRATRLRKGADGRLVSALDLVVEGQRLVVEQAPSRMRTRVRTLGFAVTNMTIAVEDFRTTDRLETAASNVKRRTTALRRSIESFRSWVGCPADGEAGQAEGEAGQAEGGVDAGDPGAPVDPGASATGPSVAPGD